MILNIVLVSIIKSLTHYLLVIRFLNNYAWLYFCRDIIIYSGMHKYYELDELDRCIYTFNQHPIQDIEHSCHSGKLLHISGCFLVAFLLLVSNLITLSRVCGLWVFVEIAFWSSMAHPTSSYQNCPFFFTTEPKFFCSHW